MSEKDSKTQLPLVLKLEFSEAADYDRANEFFDPKLKNEIDSANHISHREDVVLRDTVAKGCATFLSDEQGSVMTLAVDYQVHMNDNPAPDEQHDYTEMATVMSRIKMRGFQSATLAVSATALKELWVHPPKKALMTGIEHKNIPPQRISAALSWFPVPASKKLNEMFYTAYKTAIEPEPTGEARKEVGFYECVDQAIITQAKEVLKFMDAGCITNKKTGETIPLDLSALEDVGLTRARLEAAAKGNLSRASLEKIGAPAP